VASILLTLRLGTDREFQKKGSFQLEFVSIIRVKDHMTCYKLDCSHWWKIYLKKNPLQDLLSSLNSVISTNESTLFITGHVIYNPAYTYKFQLKTTNVTINLPF
jgi:hypothetical protein